MNKLKTLDDFMQEIIEERYLSNLKRILEVNSKETIISFIKEASQRYSKYIAIEFAEWRAENKEYAMCGIGGSFNNEFDQFIKERS